MDWRIDTASDTPPSKQLVEAVLDALVAGSFVPGDRLPSVRRLGSEALVNPNTVSKAYRELELMGAVEGRSGCGVFVAAGGVAVARAAREEATLDAFLRGCRAALRAGHSVQTLSGLVLEESVRKPA